MIEVHLDDYDDKHEDAVCAIADEIVLTLQDLIPAPNKDEICHCILAMERVMACMIHVGFPGNDWQRVTDTIGAQILRRLNNIDINLAKGEVKH